MKNLIISLVLLIGSSELVAQTSPECTYESLKNRRAQGVSVFNWQPDENHDGVAFGATLSWECYPGRAIGSNDMEHIFKGVWTYSLSPNNLVWIDGKSYSINDLGVDIYSKIKPIQGIAVIDMEVLTGDLGILDVGGRFFHNVYFNAKNDISIFFTKDKWCLVLRKSFILNTTLRKDASFNFEGIQEARQKISYNEHIKKGDEFFLKKDYINAQSSYYNASNAIKNDKYAKDKLAEIDKILQQKRQEQFLPEETKKAASDWEKETNEASKYQNDQQKKSNVSEEPEAPKPILTTQQKIKQEEEKRKIEEFNNAQRTYEQSAARLNQIEQQSLAIQNTITNTIYSAVADNKAYSRYKEELSKVLTMPKATDPQEILNAYELKLEEANKLHEQRRKVLDANLERIVQEEKNKADNELQKSTSELVGIGAQLMNNKAIEKAKEESARELKELKENSFNELKNEIQKSNRLSYENYTKLAAGELKEKDEAIYLNMASYHLCIIQSIENNFSYNHSNWIKTSCIIPKVNKPQEKKYSPDAKELYEAAVRKSKKIDDPFFKQGTYDYIDLAIKTDPQNAEYYYFKSTIVENVNTKISLLKLALEKNHSHKLSEGDLQFYLAKSALNLADMYKFRKDYPNSIHWSEATSIINYLEDIKTLEGLLESKKISEANLIHEKVKLHPLYSRNQIKNLEMLNFMEEEICYKKALENDTKANTARKRRSYYTEYLTKYPNGIYKDTAELRIKYLDMYINGYNLVISSSFNIGDLLTKTDNVTMSGGGIFLSSFLFLYKNPTSKFPRLDLEIFGGINFNGGTNTTEQIKRDSNSYFADVENKNRITFMGAGLQLWFGKMVGVSLSYNGINLKRGVTGDLHTFWKDVYGQEKKTIHTDQELFYEHVNFTKVVPGFSFAPINNEKYLVKLSYNQFKYKENESDYQGFYYGVPVYGSQRIDLLFRNFEVGGHMIIEYYNRKYVIGACYKASSIKNQAAITNKYDYSNDKLDYLQISFGFKF